MHSVTWYDAVLYCNKRSKIEARDTVYSYTRFYGPAGTDAGPCPGLSLTYLKTVIVYRLKLNGNTLAVQVPQLIIGIPLIQMLTNGFTLIMANFVWLALNYPTPMAWTIWGETPVNGVMIGMGAMRALHKQIQQDRTVLQKK